MTEKQEKITLLIEILYSFVWLGVIVGSFVATNDYWIIGLIILNTGWLASTLWLVLFSSATDNLATITLLAVMIGNVVSAIVMNYY